MEIEKAKKCRELLDLIEERETILSEMDRHEDVLAVLVWNKFSARNIIKPNELTEDETECILSYVRSILSEGLERTKAQIENM